MSSYDVTVVGAGCVGCSVAKHLVEKSNLDVAVLEKEYLYAQHQSGRNSGVLHPGFNYPPGSTKAEFATEGTNRFKEYAEKKDIPLLDCGVVVVAKDEKERQHLRTLQGYADENGVKTEFLEERGDLLEHEPHTDGIAGMYCPEAASVDSQKYTLHLANDAESDGARFYLGHELQTVKRGKRRNYVMETSSGNIETDYVVNAAGLYADKVAEMMGVQHRYQIVPFRGRYYELVPQKTDMVKSMIYPTPDPDLPFLGIHYTRRTDGKVIAGPNAVLAFGREAYSKTSVSPKELLETLEYEGFRKLMESSKMKRVAWNELNKSYRKKKFVEYARKLLPKVTGDDLTKSYAGNRAQLVSDEGELVKDPVFEERENSIHVLNAVSPGLTCSLPFGDHISGLVLQNF
ncbi:MAG: L-2-hydroxyglutarate oxidase [Halobacteria archaeon]